MKVLIVDDEKLIRDVIKEYCLGNDYEVIEAENGIEAIDKARDADIIIMDIIMPKMDGFAAYKVIKEKYNTPTIILSARSKLSKIESLKNDLMANVGHDLKTPLTMIKAYAEMTRDFKNLPLNKRSENMDIIIEETDRLNNLVEDILDLSKIQSNAYKLKIEKVNLDEIIKNIIKRYYILIDNEGYEFIYNNNEPIIVKADKKRIEQVIYNLINNAINYTGKDKRVYIDIKKEKKKVIVEIRDTGKGIDENDIKYIWNRYYYNEKKHKRNAIGTGLGLSIVKTILESHNYKYGVSSIKGKGSTFFFEIDN